MSTQTPAPRFGPDFVDDYRRRKGKLPSVQRQLTYDIAVEDEYRPWREWLDEQLAHLPGDQADALAGKLWLDEHFWPVMMELATGAGLRAAGLRVAYEQAWDGLTPDWTVLRPDGRPECFIEVHTDSPPPEVFARIRAWHGLVEHIKKILVPVILTLAPSSTGPVPPPDSRTAKKIAQEIRRELLRLHRPTYITAHGYTFLVRTGPTGHLARSPLGLRALFVAPSPGVGSVTARNLADRAEAKTSKYRHLTEKYDVPLVVAVGAHRFTGVDVAVLDDLLAGAATFTMQFGPGDPWIGEHTVDLARPPGPWVMPADLAGVLWVHNQPPFGLTWRPNPAARRPAPPAIARTEHSLLTTPPSS